MILRWVSAAMLGAVTTCSALAAIPKPERFERAWYAMGTLLEISITGMDRDKALSASEAAYESIQKAENRLSTWKDQSELSKLNRTNVGQSFSPSPALLHEINDALECAKKTDFAFNPWTGPLVRAWGLRSGGRIPSDSEIQAALHSMTQNAFQIKAGKVYKNISGAAFEEGGFGKGAGLDDAISSLKQNGVRQAVLNFGGQLSVLGDKSESVDISNPADRSKSLLRFEMSEGSVATSSNSEHGLQVGKQKIGHILNASTGRPAPFEGSTTIVAPTGAAADCMTKVFVLGPDKSLKWANKNSIQLLWIIPSPRKGHKRWIARLSCAWKFQLEAISPNVEIQKDCST